jgi:hypothetical protein
VATSRSPRLLRRARRGRGRLAVDGQQDVDFVGDVVAEQHPARNVPPDSAGTFSERCEVGE